MKSQRLPKRRRLWWLLVLPLMVFVPWVFAQDAVPGDNCQLMINNSQVDYGQTTRGQMLQQGQGQERLSFGKRMITVNVLCQQATPIALWVRGSGGEQFSFGSQGQVTIRAKNVRLDSGPVMVMTDNVQPAHELMLKPGDRLQPVTSVGLPLTGKSMTLQLEIDTNIANAATRVNQELLLKQDLTLELVAR